MRMTQLVGLSPEARRFLDENEVPRETCPCCGQVKPRLLPIVGHCDGMFDDESYSLYRHPLKDGRTADEFLQTSPWSSGPVLFFGLRVSDGTEFVWSETEIADQL